MPNNQQTDEEFFDITNDLIVNIKIEGGRKTMGKIIKKNVVDRKPSMLYYIDGKGNVCEAKMARGGKRKKKKAVKKKLVKKKR